jgi:hypothetical protein
MGLRSGSGLTRIRGCSFRISAEPSVILNEVFIYFLSSSVKYQDSITNRPRPFPYICHSTMDSQASECHKTAYQNEKLVFAK